MIHSHKICILGGGTAGWMAACLMAKQWGEKVHIRVIESPDIGIIGVGEGSTPSLKRFFEILEIPECDWMPACQATYKLSIRFEGWSPASGVSSYSHPFISQPDTFTERAFHVNCKTRRLGLDVTTQPEKFLLNGVLAKLGKAAQTPENFPFRMEYGYHFNSGLLGEYLADYAKGLGVERTQVRIEQATRNYQGDIESLVDESGRAYSADMFVDCTGFNAFLIEKTLNVDFNSFADNLFNDSAVVLATEPSKTPPVETLSKALSNGWMWRIPLTARYGNGYVYSGSYLSKDDAETELRRELNCLESDVEARHLSMRVGQRARHWDHNCLALGLSQGFIEPLEATALHLVQVAVLEFIHRYEEGNFTAKNRHQYNNFVTERYERVRDYIVAHYKLNTRDDSQYWRDNRENNQLSSSLGSLFNTWFRRGDLPEEISRLGIGDHFNTTSWHCLFAGYGAFPPLAPNQPGRGDLYKEQKIEQFLEGCSLNFESHKAVLAKLA
jgi:hypothetical protein